jgi:glycosyltransferase involved in cell wall biosynthesis
MPPMRRSRRDRSGGPVLLFEEGGRGGIADYTEALAEALFDGGLAVELATATDHEYALPASLPVHPVIRFLRPSTRWNRLLRRLRLNKAVTGVRFLFAIARLARLARRARLVHIEFGRFPPLTLLLTVVLRLQGVPVVFTPHNVFDRGRRIPGARSATAALADRVIVHARADLAALPARARARAVVIPHGEYARLAEEAPSIDPARARAGLGLPPEVPVTMLFGQLRPDKGIADLLEAARHVPELHVVLAGEELGGLQNAEDALDAPELAGRVVVRRGFQPIADAAALFAAADTVALPYAQASASGVLFLAYGFDRPVIVYPVGGLPDAVVDGETGWVCARADAAALREALSAVVAAGPQESRRRGAAGRRLADERYSWREIARRTAEVYGSLG